MRIKNKTLMTIVFVLITVLSVGLITSFVKLDKLTTTKEISPLSFSVCSITEDGKIDDENTGSIATKKFIAAEGLTIEIAEDANIKYSVYFYDASQKLLASNGVVADQEGNFSSVPEGAKYCKIMITPNSDADVTLTEVYGYASQLTIKVNK